MLVLALDTTTRSGSAALLRDGTCLDRELGDGARTHGERLPHDLIRLLDRQRMSVDQIDLFAVAAGPGSFTGLRIGIATMQGLALATGKRLAAVSALDALHAAVSDTPAPPRDKATAVGLVGVWMDAQRDEVFSALYDDGAAADGPSVAAPLAVLRRWAELAGERPPLFIGDGAVRYEALINSWFPAGSVVRPVPPLAPAVGRLAGQQAAAGATILPDDIRPIYIRRPDAELARDRRV